MPRAVLALIVSCTTAGTCFAAESEFVDTAATYLAIFIIIAMPIGGTVLFWMVHILPEKVAEKRHHPQKDAIKVLCILSLVFGGMLWPLAWLWAYSKPVMHQLAYGRDKHDDYYGSDGASEKEGKGEGEGAGTENAEIQTLSAKLGRLRQDIDALEQSGDVSSGLQAIRNRLAELDSAAVGDTKSAGAG